MPFSDPERGRAYQREYRRVRRAGDDCTTPGTTPIPLPFRLQTAADVLDLLEEIPVCMGYRLKGQEVTEMPATYRALEAIEPVYQKLAGWQTSTRGINCYDKLPEKARAYLKFLEDRTGVEVGGVSTGPERNETIIRLGSKLERLIG